RGGGDSCAHAEIATISKAVEGRPRLTLDGRLSLTAHVQRAEQHPARGGHVTHGTVERGLVGLGGPVEAADLAHELQRGVVQLLVAGRMIGVSQAFDVSAHTFAPSGGSSVRKLCAPHAPRNASQTKRPMAPRPATADPSLARV